MTKHKKRDLKFDSKAVFYKPDEGSNSINFPIFMSSSFEYDADIYRRVVDGERKSVNIYGRCGNPNEYQFEKQMITIFFSWANSTNNEISGTFIVGLAMDSKYRTFVFSLMAERTLSTFDVSTNVVVMP